MVIDGSGIIVGSHQGPEPGKSYLQLGGAGAGGNLIEPSPPRIIGEDIAVLDAGARLLHAVAGVFNCRCAKRRDEFRLDMDMNNEHGAPQDLQIRRQSWHLSSLASSLIDQLWPQR